MSAIELDQSEPSTGARGFIPKTGARISFISHELKLLNRAETADNYERVHSGVRITLDCEENVLPPRSYGGIGDSQLVTQLTAADVE